MPTLTLFPIVNMNEKMELEYLRQEVAKMKQKKGGVCLIEITLVGINLR